MSLEDVATRNREREREKREKKKKEKRYERWEKRASGKKNSNRAKFESTIDNITRGGGRDTGR